MLNKLLAGADVEIPVYDFSTHSRYVISHNIYRVEGEVELVKSCPIIIFEGILSLYDVRIRELMDIKIFVLTDDDIRLARRCNYSETQHFY